MIQKDDYDILYYKKSKTAKNLCMWYNPISCSFFSLSVCFKVSSCIGLKTVETNTPLIE